MGRAPCCSKEGLNKGAWTAMEDKTLVDYIEAHGEGQWTNLAKKAGLKRCGKSCRLRWLNYLRPNIKRGNITPDEEELIMRLHKLLGNRWCLIAGRLPGRTDNEIKNYWNTKLGKKLQSNPTNSSQHLQLQLHSSSNTEKNPTPSSHQLNIQKPSLVNVVRSEPYLSSPTASKCSKVDFQQTAYMLTDQIVEKHQEGPLVVESNETLLPVVAGEPSQNPPEFMVDFEMDENSLVDFLDCEFLKLCDFDYNGGGEERKSFPSGTGTLVISNTESNQVQHDSDFQQRQPMSPLLVSEMEWI